MHVPNSSNDEWAQSDIKARKTLENIPHLSSPAALLIIILVGKGGRCSHETEVHVSE